MKVRPTGHRILVQVLESDTQKIAREGGIALAATTKSLETASSQVAKVVALGADAYADRPHWCKVGDIVKYAKYAGEDVPEAGGEKEAPYRIINDLDVFCVLEGENHASK